MYIYLFYTLCLTVYVTGLEENPSTVSNTHVDTSYKARSFWLILQSLDTFDDARCRNGCLQDRSKAGTLDSRTPSALLKPAISAWAFTAVEEYENTAFYNEADTFDLCGGRATPNGADHYHGTPGCLQEQAMLEAGTTADEHSPILGWAFVSKRNLQCFI